MQSDIKGMVSFCVPEGVPLVGVPPNNTWNLLGLKKILTSELNLFDAWNWVAGTQCCN